MFNPIQQGAFIACYGQYGKREECGNCLCRRFCKGAAEIPFISDTSRAGQYIDQIFSSDDPEAAEKRNEELEAENKRLREALKEIEDLANNEYWKRLPEPSCVKFMTIKRYAEKALKGAGE